MAGITGLGTNYNLPNYTGILHQLTPSDTPFFSALGGLTGGGQSTDTQFEWQNFDLRTPDQPAVVEGATAPTAQARVRANASNVVQIHQEKVSVAYSKIAAYGKKSGLNNAAQNPITGEVDWQVEQMLKQMVRDIEYSFIQGSYQMPTDNTTARKTRGLLPAISTNAEDYSGSALPTVTGTASTNLISSTAHGLADGAGVIFTALTGGTGLTVGLPYYVVSSLTNTFAVSKTKGGAPVEFSTNVTAATANSLTAVTTQIVGDMLQEAYDNGGLSESMTSGLMLNSGLKRGITDVYGDAYGKYTETSRTVGGIAVDTIETDFGRLNVMLNRYMPKDTFAVVSMEECSPVYLEIPGKGHFFAEPLAKTGSSDDVQLYGEVGLAYGNELKHAKAAGLFFG